MGKLAPPPLMTPESVSSVPFAATKSWRVAVLGRAMLLEAVPLTAALKMVPAEVAVIAPVPRPANTLEPLRDAEVRCREP